MKSRFDTFFRLYIGTLVLLLGWSLWAAGTASTNPPAPPTAPDAGLATSTPTNTANRIRSFTGLDDDQLTFGLRRITFLDETRWLGEPLWKYIASCLYILLAFYLAKGLDYLTGVVVKRWTRRTETKVDDLLLDLLHGPIKVVCFVILLHIGLNLFRWPVWVGKFLSNGLKIIVALSLTYLAIKLVDLLLGLWEHRAANKKDEQFHRQLFPIIRKSVKAFVVIVSFLITAPHLGLNITGLIASLSIGGLAIGLAAQDTLGNVFGAVAVLIDKPFHVGDRIRVDTVDGIVESIGFRCTRVRNQDGFLVSIPNKTMGSATVTNISLRPTIRTVLNIGITYDTDRARIQRALQLLEEIFRPHPKTADVWITFDRFGDFALNIQVVHWWKGSDQPAYLADLQSLNLAIKERFDDERISFAYPTQTLYLRQDPAAPQPTGTPFRISQAAIEGPPEPGIRQTPV